MINLLDALLNSHAVKLYMTSKRDCGHIVCSTVHHDSPWVCGKEYDSFTRCSLYLCCSLFAQRVYTVFSFHYVDHSFFLLIILVCALSCLEWKVKFISIKSKSFVFLSFERAIKHHPHTHTRGIIQMVDCVADFGDGIECHQRLIQTQGSYNGLNPKRLIVESCEHWTVACQFSELASIHRIDMNRSETPVICNISNWSSSLIIFIMSSAQNFRYYFCNIELRASIVCVGFNENRGD